MSGLAYGTQRCYVMVSGLSCFRRSGEELIPFAIDIHIMYVKFIEFPQDNLILLFVTFLESKCLLCLHPFPTDLVEQQ
jgi:hypothetical protein